MQKTTSSPFNMNGIAKFLFACLILLSGCRDTKDPYADVAVNSAFANNPPIATNVSLSILDKPTDFGNVLYEATLPKEKIKSDMLAVFIGDSDKIVLHDDGKNGDKVAGDGIYSTVFDTNADSLRLYVNNMVPTMKRLLDENKKIFAFNGRMEFPLNERSVASLKTLGDKGSDIFLLPGFHIPVHIPLLTPVAASFKHTALTVTDVSVVNDPLRTFNPCTNVGTPGGAWTFGKLMTDLSNGSGVTPEQFMLNWLNTWKTNQTVNTDVIGQRTGVASIISAWQTLCGGTGAALDVNKAPFKLLAIVNRFDLRSGGAYGGGNAGEGRFVFCFTGTNCQPQLFLTIFEFGVNKTTCSAIHDYAQQWVDLASMPFPGAAYNTALQAITDQFAKAGTNPSKPNGSSLDQLRTNELALGVFPWELREFNISASTHLLIDTTTKREPQIAFNGTGPFAGEPAPSPADVAAFGDFVNANESDVINDKMDLPLTTGLSNIAFIAGKAHTQNPTLFHWDAIEPSGAGHITNDTARFHISFNTCSGCHGGETNNGTFTQIRAAGSTGEATMSQFLTGDPAFSSTPFLVADRANRPSAAQPIQWPFNDLERRGRDLMDFISTRCITLPHFPGLINKHIPIQGPIELTRQLTFNRITMTE